VTAKRRYDEDDYADQGEGAALIAEGFIRRELAYAVDNGKSVADLLNWSEADSYPLIEDVLTADTVTVLIGAPGAGKTFLVLDWAWSVSSNRFWLGEHEVAYGGPVLYVCGESPRSLPMRLRAWQAEHPGAKHEPDDFYAVSMRGRMGHPSAFGELSRAVKEHLGGWVKLAIFDTLSSLWGTRGESGDDGGAADVLARLGAFRDRHECTVVLTHHSGWTALRRARGSSVLEANADDVLLLTQTGQVRTLVATKRRDGEIGAPLCLRLEPMEGTDSMVLKAAHDAEDWRSRLLGVLLGCGPDGLAVADIQNRLDIDRNSPGRSGMKSALTKLVADKLVTKVDRGRYKLTAGDQQ
jgi:hypothetical protein